jgi:hypothetical protein
MAIFKRGRVYWYHFIFNGQHVQETTKQGNPRVARQMEAVHRTSLAKGAVCRQIVDDAAAVRQRKDLKRRLSEAESVFVAVASGPHAGKCNHSATADARARAMANLLPELQRWNSEHPDNPIS